MTVIARFYVNELDRNEGSPTASRIRLGAVCRGKENKQWASATPAGHIEMSVLNEAATDYFEKGAEYEVTFRKVTKPEPGDGHAVDVDQGSSMCNVCGTYGVLVDGKLDWSAHERVYGA